MANFGARLGGIARNRFRPIGGVAFARAQSPQSVRAFEQTQPGNLPRRCALRQRDERAVRHRRRQCLCERCECGGRCAGRGEHSQRAGDAGLRGTLARLGQLRLEQNDICRAGGGLLAHAQQLKRARVNGGGVFECGQVIAGIVGNLFDGEIAREVKIMRARGRVRGRVGEDERGGGLCPNADERGNRRIHDDLPIGFEREVPACGERLLGVRPRRFDFVGEPTQERIGHAQQCLRAEQTGEEGSFAGGTRNRR